MMNLLALKDLNYFLKKVHVCSTRDVKRLGYCQNNDDFEAGVVSLEGNLRDYVIGSISYDSGDFRREYLILLVPDFKIKKYKVELHLVAFDRKVINSFVDCDGFYGKLVDFDISDNVLDKVLDYVRNKVGDEEPVKVCAYKYNQSL